MQVAGVWQIAGAKVKICYEIYFQTLKNYAADIET